MKIKKNVLCIILVLLSLSGHAAEGDGGYEYDILPRIQHSNSITAMSFDKYGLVWIGTSYGMVRYNGFEYLPFDDSYCDAISKNTIRTICGFAERGMLIGTDAGVFLYEYADDRFIEIKASFKKNDCKSIFFTSTGNIVLAFVDGISIVDGETMHEIAAIHDEPNGPLANIRYVARCGEGLYYVWSNDLLSLVRCEGDSVHVAWSWKLNGRLLCLECTDDGEVLFCIENRTFRCRPEAGNPELSLREIACLHDREIRSLSCSGSGVCATSSYDGIFFMEKDGGTFDLLSREWIESGSPGKPMNSVRKQLRLKDGRYLFGTIEGLAVRSEPRPQPFSNLNGLSTPRISSNVVSDIHVDGDGILWVSTSGGLDRIDMRSGESRCCIPMFDGDANVNRYSRIQGIAEDAEGRLWLGTKKDVIIFDKRAGTFSKEAELAQILEDDKASFCKCLSTSPVSDVILMGFIYGDIHYWNTRTRAGGAVLFDGLDMRNANAGEISRSSDGRIWVATKTKGIIEFDGRLLDGASGDIRISEFMQYLDSDDGVSVQSILVSSRNSVFAGTSRGLYKLTDGEFVNVFNPGFDHEVWVNELQEDNDGSIWIYTTSTVEKIDNGGVWHRYELYDGAFTQIGFPLGSDKDADGNMYVGGINGVTYFNPRDFITETSDRRAIVSGGTISGKTIHKDLNGDPVIFLRSADDEIELSLCFDDLSAGNVSFLYRINGAAEFEEAGGRTIHLRDMHQGSNTVEISAAGGGETGYDPIVLTVVVPRPLWISWKAVPAYLAIAAFFIFAFFFYRRWMGSRPLISDMSIINQIIESGETNIIESADAKFISKMKTVIESNLGNPEFDLSAFAVEMGVSKTVLNMRCKKILNRAPMDLIRSTRMQKAANLLETGAYDVSHVCYTVGMNDPRYFSTSFKKHFGMTPTEYAHRKDIQHN